MEDDIGLMIAKSIAIGLVFVFGIVFLIAFIYNVSGAKDRDDNLAFECKGKGGEMIYIRDTGNVCIKGVINLEKSQ